MNFGHLSVIEHSNTTVRIVCDCGVLTVWHRQESTRYANYTRKKFGREITVIRHCFWPENSPEYALWLKAIRMYARATDFRGHFCEIQKRHRRL
ncbi:MAG: hypothetical protein LBS77_00080 [Desulfovibrio sp.]|nr:hypothetical protein [Desulfovibrio sp.]